MIQPEINTLCDLNLHEAYSQDGLEIDPRKGGERRILWIMSRGFQYKEEDEINGCRSVIIKAQVIVQ